MATELKVETQEEAEMVNKEMERSKLTKVWKANKKRYNDFSDKIQKLSDCEIYKCKEQWEG